MIGFLHGYLLEGSGSNLWTRSVLQALCRTGEVVHLVCQEPHPERYDFIAEVQDYTVGGNATLRWQREVPYAGACIMHKPALGDTLPVYVWDEYEEFERVVPMVDLAAAEIEDYLRRNVAVVRDVVRARGITVLQANHAVLMSVVAQRVHAELGVPYAVMPHGSALEYAVKPDARFHHYASGAFGAARRIFVSAAELRDRVLATFPDMPELATRMTEIRVGVDTSGFQPVERTARADNIEIVAELLQGSAAGRRPAQTRTLVEDLSADRSPNRVKRALQRAAEYDGKLPDSDAAEKLRGVDWTTGDVILFVGRLIVAKGIQCVIAALPEILQSRPGAQLVIAGHGPLREPLEALLFALRQGERGLAERLAAGSAEEDLLVSEPMSGVQEYWDRLAADGRLDAYYRSASMLLRQETVRFVGYMTHRELQWIFPCCDVGVFPSLVKESGPMVFLEALSSGCFPVGTYFAGMKQKIDAVAPYLHGDDAQWLKVSASADELAADLARTIPGAMRVAPQYARVLRGVAEREYDWQPIAAKLAATLKEIAASSA